MACFHVEGIFLLLRYSPGETLDLLRRGKDRKRGGGEGREGEQEYVYTPLSVFLLCVLLFTALAPLHLHWLCEFGRITRSVVIWQMQLTSFTWWSQSCFVKNHDYKATFCHFLAEWLRKCIIRFNQRNKLFDVFQSWMCLCIPFFIYPGWLCSVYCMFVMWTMVGSGFWTCYTLNVLVWGEWAIRKRSHCLSLSLGVFIWNFAGCAISQLGQIYFIIYQLVLFFL